ncbi:MAG TPA: leucine-rich repeat domain-containing protein [Polyangiaceae bacterium]|nr:leucine-rich repeat domain-containing protein [Polyangiaceae bacterium]
MSPHQLSLRLYSLFSLLTLISCGLVSREPIDETSTDNALGGSTSAETGSTEASDDPNQVGVCHFEDEEFAQLVRRSSPYGSADHVLNVWALSIDDDVTSLQGIDCLSGLAHLYFERSWWSPPLDLAPVGAVTTLDYVHITDGAYESAHVLSTLPLSSIRLTSLDWTSLDALEGSDTIDRLVIEDMPAQDLSALASLTNLRWLRLDDTLSTDLSPLVDLDLLQEIEVRDVPVKTLPRLGLLDHLSSLWLEDTDIVSLEGLAGAPELVFVGIFSPGLLENLGGLEALPLLHTLIIEDSDLSDVSALTGSTSLKRVEVINAQLEDISPLGACENLTRLVLSDNSITDLSPLRALSLHHLNVARNQIENVTPLIGKPLLTFDLTANNITTLPADFIGAQSGCQGTLLEQNPLDGPSIDLLKTLCSSTDYTFLWDGGGCDRCPDP